VGTGRREAAVEERLQLAPVGARLAHSRRS
jgi:hypothetical protein